MWSQFTGKTPAENLSGYTYIPLDPFSVITEKGRSCKENKGSSFATLAKSLPDNAVRMSVEQFNESGTVTYGPAGAVQRGETYRVTVDYINSDTAKIELWIAKTMEHYVDKDTAYVDILKPNDGTYTYNSEVYKVLTEPPVQDIERFIRFNLPVYIGIGLRVTAEINVLSGKANISGIGGIGAEVEASHVKGNLTVQTLGINGQKVSAALPIQSELNKTTAQNAIVAISQIKTLIHDEKDTVKSARVLGLYLPFPGGQSLVNSIISAISEKGITWYRACAPIQSENGTKQPE